MHNTVSDYEFDRNDPGKANYPLIEGKFSYNTVAYYTSLLNFISSISIVIFTLFVDKDALLYLFIAFICGHTYNDFAFSKRSFLASVIYGLYNSMLVLYGNFLCSDYISDTVLMTVLYFFFVDWHMILFLGRLKDYHESKSELKVLGLIRGDEVVASVKAYLVIAIMHIPIFTILIMVGVLSLPLIAAALFFDYLMLRPHKINRRKDFWYIIGFDTCLYYAMVVSLAPRMGVGSLIFLFFPVFMVFSVRYFSAKP